MKTTYPVGKSVLSNTAVAFDTIDMPLDPGLAGSPVSAVSVASFGEMIIVIFEPFSKIFICGATFQNIPRVIPGSFTEGAS